MKDIEDLVSSFSGLPTAISGRWSVAPLVEKRIYLSRDELGRFAIFLLGDEKSFGAYPKASGITHSKEVVPIPGGDPFSALRLTSSSLTNGNRIMAHIAYEFDRRLASDSSLSNSQLIAEISWVLELLADQDNILTPEGQKGLVGELVLLRRLLIIARELGLPASEPLARWYGYDGAKRDFASKAVVIEVKTTSKHLREHYIGSLNQLDAQAEEEVFIYSLGVRLDPTAPRKLPAFIYDVLGLLQKHDGSQDEDAKGMFMNQIKAYGYDHSKEKLYNAGLGFMNFHLNPKLYREQKLDRLSISSFKGERLPTMVSEVMYMLNIHDNELTVEEERDVLVRFLESPPMTG